MKNIIFNGELYSDKFEPRFASATKWNEVVDKYSAESYDKVKDITPNEYWEAFADTEWYSVRTALDSAQYNLDDARECYWDYDEEYSADEVAKWEAEVTRLEAGLAKVPVPAPRQVVFHYIGTTEWLERNNVYRVINTADGTDEHYDFAAECSLLVNKHIYNGQKRIIGLVDYDFHFCTIEDFLAYEGRLRDNEELNLDSFKSYDIDSAGKRILPAETSAYAECSRTLEQQERRLAYLNEELSRGADVSKQIRSITNSIFKTKSKLGRLVPPRKVAPAKHVVGIEEFTTIYCIKNIIKL